ncbi:MAG: EscU/YscU/HrcU family type III secretion system export apparatus switch protein [Burkholderiaceae bacterium]
MAEEKSEEPTRHKLRKAREEGQTARSTDLTGSVTMLFALITLLMCAPAIKDAAKAAVTTSLQFVGGHDHSMENLEAQIPILFRDLIYAVLPMLIVSMITPLIANIVQTSGVAISTKTVTPNLERVNPLSGLKRIFSMRSMIDLLKMLVKAAIVGIMVYETFLWVAPLVANSMFQPLPQLSKLLWDAMFRFVAAMAVAALVIGLLDFKIQHHMLMRKLRMTIQEVRREHKEHEGDPKMKQERKRLARELLEAAPRARVTLANLMVVNPTHYAVAIRYAPDEHPLPRVVAKGVDENAAELRRYAHEASVPIIGNPPVARRLYLTEVDAPIPVEMFETVAALLRWVDAIGPQRENRSLPC